MTYDTLHTEYDKKRPYDDQDTHPDRQTGLCLSCLKPWLGQSRAYPIILLLTQSEPHPDSSQSAHSHDDLPDQQKILSG